MGNNRISGHFATWTQRFNERAIWYGGEGGHHTLGSPSRTILTPPPHTKPLFLLNLKTSTLYKHILTFNPNYPLSENCYFSGTKPPFDLSAVCNFKFVHDDPVEKKRALLLSWFNRGSSTNFEDDFFQILILCHKITISPQPNIWLTSDQSVNLSLSVVVQLTKNRALVLSRFNRGSLTKFENAFFQKRFMSIFNKITDFSKTSQGICLKARGLVFWILVIHIHILTPVKTDLAKHIKIVNFKK